MNDNFDYGKSAELYSGTDAVRRGFLRHLRFSSSAKVIQFAIEELPQELLANVTLVVNRQTFRAEAIIGLYMAAAYPLSRTCC